MPEVDFAVLFDTAPPASALLSADLVYITVNRAYERLVDRSRRDLIGRTVFEVFPSSPSKKEADALRHSLERVLAEGEIDIMAVQRYDVHVSGSPETFEERYWNIVNSPLLDGAGKIYGVVNQPQDVTPFIQHMRRLGTPVPDDTASSRMAAVEARLFAQTSRLHKINERLRWAHVQERRVSTALRKAVQRQREAVDDTSHDLRGPLTGLLTRLQVALEDPEADSRETLLSALQDAERLGDIVGDLLELARMESGAPAETEPVSLSHLAGNELLRHAPDLAITTYLDTKVIVDGSPVRLARLVSNLLANAERHARSHLEVRVGAQDGQAVLEVIDDGPGIPDSDKEAVFDRFYRRSASRRKDPGGSGLGLPIARQIAQTHGGTLRVHDRADGSPGARLVLRLPLNRPDAGAGGNAANGPGTA